MRIKYFNILFLLIGVGFLLDGCGGVRSEPTGSILETALPSSSPTFPPLGLLPEHTSVGPTNTPTLVPTPSGPFVYINVINNAFDNDEITIPTGTTVVWSYAGDNTHTVTSVDGLFDKTLIGESSFYFTFKEPGTYRYLCLVHQPSGLMNGVIIVTEE